MLITTWLEVTAAAKRGYMGGVAEVDLDEVLIMLLHALQFVGSIAQIIGREIHLSACQQHWTHGRRAVCSACTLNWQARNGTYSHV